MTRFSWEIPQKLYDMYGQYMPEIKPDDMKDYQPAYRFSWAKYIQRILYAPMARAAMNLSTAKRISLHRSKWPYYAKSAILGSQAFAERYKYPIIYYENGISCPDVVSLDGKVHDPNRIDFLNRYFTGIAPGS